jgi:hypothetical protein
MIDPPDLGSSLRWIVDKNGDNRRAHLALLKREIELATTLESMGELTLKYFLVEGAFRNLDIGIRALGYRFDWARGSTSTLQVAAESVGLTRERIRQLQEKLGDGLHSLELKPKLFERMSTVSEGQSTVEGLERQLMQLGIVSSESNWTLTSIEHLLQIVGTPNSSDFLAGLHVNEKPSRSDLRGAVPIIRQMRNCLGLIDLNDLCNQTGLSRSVALAAIRSSYGLVFETDALALAVSRPPGTLIRTLGIQLMIQNFLTPGDVLVGIDRQLESRQGLRVGTPQQIIEVIELLVGNPCDLNSIDPSFRQEIQLTSTQIWFRELFNSSTTGLLHRDQIIEAAIEDGQSLGSIGAWTTNSPIIRRVALGVYCLVGTVTTVEEAEAHRAQAINVALSSTVDFKVLSSQILEMRVSPSVGAFGSGAFFASAELQELIEGLEFSEDCKCGLLVTESRIRIAPSKFLIGLSSMLNHARIFHGINPGEQLTVLFDFQSEVATLCCT